MNLCIECGRDFQARHGEPCCPECRYSQTEKRVGAWVRMSKGCRVGPLAPRAGVWPPEQAAAVMQAQAGAQLPAPGKLAEREKP